MSSNFPEFWASFFFGIILSLRGSLKSTTLRRLLRSDPVQFGPGLKFGPIPPGPLPKERSGPVFSLSASVLVCDECWCGYVVVSFWWCGGVVVRRGCAGFPRASTAAGANKCACLQQLRDRTSKTLCKIDILMHVLHKSFSLFFSKHEVPRLPLASGLPGSQGESPGIPKTVPK